MIGMATDVLCLRCGYNLHGLSAGKVCPECGLGVGRSLDVGDGLDRGRPVWLRKLAGGSMLLLGAQVILLALLAFLLYGQQSTRTIRIVAATPVVLAVMHCAALLLLTWPENNFEKRRPGNRIRIAVRVLSFNSPATVVCLWMSGRNGVIDRRWLYAAAACWILLAPCCLLTFLYLRRLALRVLDPGLAEHCAIVGCGSATTIILILGFIAGQDHLQGPSIWSLVLVGAILVTALLFVIWSTFLLIFFAINFRRAHREALRSWKLADAAALDGGGGSSVG